MAEENNTLLVSLIALFRSGERWAVFKVMDDAARLTFVDIGERNLNRAVVRSGLIEGDIGITCQNDRIVEGVPIAERQMLR